MAFSVGRIISALRLLITIDMKIIKIVGLIRIVLCNFISFYCEDSRFLRNHIVLLPFHSFWGVFQLYAVCGTYHFSNVFAH